MFKNRISILLPIMIVLIAACAPQVDIGSNGGASGEISPVVDGEVEPSAPTEIPAVVVTEIEPTEVESREIDFQKYEELTSEMRTLLPPDGIPSIDNPTFHTANEANEYYEPDELVIGVVFDGDARAYSIPHLSSHEIVNDEVGGVKISVTW